MTGETPRHRAAPAARIGPNAIIQTAAALRSLEGEAAARRIFRAACLDRYLEASPQAMVDEREVARLHGVVCDRLGAERARLVNAAAGRLTADYLLSHRIPRSAQVFLSLLPAALASRLLCRAITRNAWTFAGTGAFAVHHGRPTVFEISNCPLCRQRRCAGPICDFYAATFQGLFARLVHRSTRVTEIACEAAGAPACRFELIWHEGP